MGEIRDEHFTIVNCLQVVSSVVSWLFYLIMKRRCEISRDTAWSKKLVKNFACRHASLLRVTDRKCNVRNISVKRIIHVYRKCVCKNWSAFVRKVIYNFSILSSLSFFFNKQCTNEFRAHPKMRVLRFTFKLLTIIGCWRPESWSSRYMRITYDAYTIFMVVLLYTFLVSQFLDIIWNVDNPDDFTENFYATLASVVSCSKMLSLLVNRNNIDTLTNVLAQRPYRPSKTEEIKIRYKFDKLIQWVYLRTRE